MSKFVEGIRKYAMTIVLFLVVIFFAVMSEGKILQEQNINNLIAQNAYVFVLATGMLYSILTGGNIDLSVGSIVCFVGAVGGTMMVTWTWPVWLSMLCMILIGILIGVWQGFWIAYMNIPPWITTLAGMLMFRGLGNVVLKGLTISNFPPAFVNMFNGYVPALFGYINIGEKKADIFCLVVGLVVCAVIIFAELRNRRNRTKKGYELEPIYKSILKTCLICAVVLFIIYKLAMYKGIPFILIWIAVIMLVYNFIASKTILGRHFYTVGGNVEAAKMSGVDTRKIYFLAYVNIAFLSAVAGMITMSRLSSATPTAGNLYELDAISSCFVGGASAYGGSGTIPGMIVGASLIGVINLGMSLMRVDTDWQKIVKGLVLLVAVIFEVLNKRQKA